jgi:hypothetical protein
MVGALVPVRSARAPIFRLGMALTLLVFFGS